MDWVEALRFNYYTMTRIAQAEPGDHLGRMSCQLFKNVKLVSNT